MPNLALQAIRAPGPSINTSLRIKTLLANNLITEAFELQRSKFDEQYFLEFLKGCHEHKKWNYVLGLSLTDQEGEILCKFLRTCDSLLSENLQLLYLLQRNRYIEALTYLDDMKHKPRSMSMQKKLENTQDRIISSYKLAMNSTNRTLCDQYMEIKNRLQVDVQQNNEIISPLSSQLNPYIVDSNANVVGSVFHRAIVSAKRTGFDDTSQKSHIPLLGNIRIEFDVEDVDEHKPVLEPTPYIGLLKRRKEISYENIADPDQRQPAAKRQRTDSFSMADLPPKKNAPGINSYLMTSLTNQSQIAKKQLNHLDLDDTVVIDNDQRNSMGELCETVNLLSTPVVKSSRLDKHRIESRCQTPQSILKQRHTEAGSIVSRRSTSPSLTVHSARRSVDFNAKPFCYKIPSQNDEYLLGAIEETGQIQEDDDSSSINSPSSIKGRRAIHSGKNSSASNSIDEFYSPETSKVQEEHEKSIHDADNNEISRISQQDTSMPSTEIPIMSSTRITRSRSKLNLEDTIDYENVAPQPPLNTSTPKRATPKRSPSRSLSKNVITTNALKAQSEAKKLTIDKEQTQSPIVGSPDVVAESKRNYLNDASEMSVKQSSMAYSTDELDATYLKPNLLHDSSSFASQFSESDVVEKLSEHEQSTQEQIDEEIEEEIDTETEEQTNAVAEEQIEQQVQDVEYVVDVQTAEQSNADYSMESMGNEPNIAQVQENIEIASVTPSSTQSSILPTVVVTETVSEQTTITRKLPQNYLVDSSMGASESIMQKFNRYEHYTSSFFSETTHTKNLLEDSSICTPQSTAESASNVDSEKDVVNIDDLEDDDDEDDESKSDTSSNNTISSEESSDNEIEGDLVYEDSDNEQNNEVIQISSSSEDSNKSEKSSNDIHITDSHDQQYGEYDDDLKYDINDEFATTSQPNQATDYGHEHIDEYRIAELQTAPIQLDIPPPETEAQSLISQEQAMNEMIYGDLGVADAEMLDLDVHNDAFGFEMHGDRGVQNQGSVYLEAVEMASKRTEHQEVQLVLDEPSSGHAAVSGGEQLQPSDNIQEPSVSQEQPKESVIDNNNGIKNSEEEPVSNSVSTHDESKVDDIPIQVSPIPYETNVFNKGVIIDETAAVDSTTKEQPEITSAEPMESTEIEIEPTNIFENAAIASTLDVTAQVDKLTQENEEEIVADKPVDTKKIKDAPKTPKKTTKKDDSDMEKTPARRTRRAASQQDETAQLVDVVKEVPKIKSKLKKATSQQSLASVEEVEVSSRSKRAKSQQPPEPKIAEEERKQRGASEQRDFTIKIKRLNEETIVTTAKSDVVDEYDKKRKKRGASQQKELPIKVQPEDESSTSKATTTKRTRNKSVTESGLGDKFDAEESVSTRRLRKATSHQSLSDAVESTIEESTTKRGKSPSRKKSEPRAPRRAASHQSLSSISDSGNQADEESTSRTTRAKSVSMQDISHPRTRRAASQSRLDDIDEKQEIKVQKRKKVKSESTDSESELGDRFDAYESAPSRRLRNAVSHQTLSKIIESAYEESPPAKKGRTRVKNEPTTPRTTRRATSIQSLSSAADDEPKDVDAAVTKTRSRKRLKSDTSDQTEESQGTESKTSKSRSRRATSETEKSPKVADSAKESRKKSTRSSKKDDDTHSDASSIISTRSRRANTDDETSSVKSSKVRATRSGSVLPAIAEDEGQATSSLSQDYLETSRLTRSQRATIEKYSKLKEKISADESTSRRKASKTKADNTIDEQQLVSDQSDSESIISQKSAVSRASKRSKTSEVSSSQRTTRQRTQKK